MYTHTLGAFVFSLPQFVFGSYQVGSSATAQLESCDAGADFSSECDSTNSFALAFFFIGNILIGVGAAPLFTVGTAYLDDIVKPKHVSIHLGLVYLLTVVGPALGYGLGGIFLNIYVDPLHETNLEPTDPGWVGAWWLCFIFSGVVSWLLAVPFLLFPRLLPDSHLVKKERELEMAQKYKSKYGSREDTDFVTKLKSFPYHLKQVVTTVSWVFITGAVCSSIIVLAGMVSFAPKYLESQFSLTASSASLIAGGVGKFKLLHTCLLPPSHACVHLMYMYMCMHIHVFSLSLSLSLSLCLSLSHHSVIHILMAVCVCLL